MTATAVISSEPVLLADEPGQGNKLIYRRVGRDDSGTVQRSQTHRRVRLDGGRPVEVATYSVSDGSLSSRGLYEWKGTRLERTYGKMSAGGVEIAQPAWEFRWNYDCQAD